jgi:uncharacterized Zn finger protein
MFPAIRGARMRAWTSSSVPSAPLKFRFAAELEEHLALEHPDFEAKPRGRDEDSMSAARRNRQIRSEREEDRAESGPRAGKPFRT